MRKNNIGENRKEKPAESKPLAEHKIPHWVDKKGVTVLRLGLLS